MWSGWQCCWISVLEDIRKRKAGYILKEWFVDSVQQKIAISAHFILLPIPSNSAEMLFQHSGPKRTVVGLAGGPRGHKGWSGSRAATAVHPPAQVAAGSKASDVPPACPPLCSECIVAAWWGRHHGGEPGLGAFIDPKSRVLAGFTTGYEKQAYTYFLYHADWLDMERSKELGRAPKFCLLIAGTLCVLSNFSPPHCWNFTW